MGNIIYGFAFIIRTVLTIYFYIVIASAILSWVNPDPYNPIVRFLRNATEPIYAYIRRYMPFLYVGGFDLSPLVLILIIQFLQIALVGNLVDFSNSLRYNQNHIMP
jgi:YggT family protein